MSFPEIGLPEARSFLTAWLNGENPDEPPVGWRESAVEVTEDAIDRFAARLRLHQRSAAAMRGTKRSRYEAFEQAGAETVFRFAQGLPAECVVSPGFWCYLSVCKVLDVVSWRHPATAKSKPALSNFAAVSTQLREALLMRLYLRGAIGYDPIGQSFDLAEVSGQDLWRSHIIRVKLGNAPQVARAMLEIYQGEQPSLEVLREWAKGLTEVRSNVLFEVLEPAQAEGVVREQLNAAASKASS